MKNTLILACALVTGSFALTSIVRAETDKVALAREVIQLTQMDKNFEAIIPQIRQMTEQMVAGQLASMNPEQRAVFDRFQTKATDVALTAARAMLAKVDTLYAEVYSEEELVAMKAFFSSAVGKGMMAKQPQIMQRMMPLMQAMQGELMPKIQGLVAEFQGEIAALKAQGAAPAMPAAPSAPAVGLPAVGK